MISATRLRSSGSLGSFPSKMLYESINISMHLLVRSANSALAVCRFTLPFFTSSTNTASSTKSASGVLSLFSNLTASAQVKTF